MSAPATPLTTDSNQAASGSFRDVLKYFLYLGTFGFGGPIALAGYMQRDLVALAGKRPFRSPSLHPDDAEPSVSEGAPA